MSGGLDGDGSREGDPRTVGDPTVWDRVVVDEQLQAPPVDPLLLITNDDGIDAPGLRGLARRLAEDFDVLVVAPGSDMSGTGTALGRLDSSAGVEMRRVDLDGVEDAFTIDGPPGLAVVSAARGAFGPKPDLVVSGVNAGMNTGHSVIHSGTVGAALTARTLGIHGLAVSLAASDPWHWDTAFAVARSAADWVLSHVGPRIVLNLNLPGLPLSEVKGIRWADLDEFGYLRVATADIPGERIEFELTGSAAGLDPASDTALCFDGFATVTLLSAVHPLPFPPADPTEIWFPSSLHASQ
jgi:5'-nucleotidase